MKQTSGLVGLIAIANLDRYPKGVRVAGAAVTGLPALTLDCRSSARQLLVGMGASLPEYLGITG